jgi:hypothetical protein
MTSDDVLVNHHFMSYSGKLYLEVGFVLLGVEIQWEDMTNFP